MNEEKQIKSVKSDERERVVGMRLLGGLFVVAILIGIIFLIIPKCESCGSINGVSDHNGAKLCFSCWSSISNKASDSASSKNSGSSSYNSYSSNSKASGSSGSYSSGSSGNSSYSSFTNKYGTPTTKCAHSGCTNYIESSGDTNCCTQHSNRCYECHKYIDGDAMWCIDCLKKALGY